MCKANIHGSRVFKGDGIEVNPLEIEVSPTGIKVRLVGIKVKQAGIHAKQVTCYELFIAFGIVVCPICIFGDRQSRVNAVLCNTRARAATLTIQKHPPTIGHPLL